MPKLTLELRPPGRRAVPHKAKNRYNSPLAQELAEAMRTDRRQRDIPLTEEFARAADGRGSSGGKGEGDSSGGPKPPSPSPPKDRSTRKRDRDRGRDKDFER